VTPLESQSITDSQTRPNVQHSGIKTTCMRLCALK